MAESNSSEPFLLTNNDRIKIVDSILKDLS